MNEQPTATGPTATEPTSTEPPETITPMHILAFPRDAALLRRKARPIREDEFGSDALRDFGASLAWVMMEAKALGLASTQVEEAPGGEPWRMFAMRLDGRQYGILCNPEILDAADERIGSEACLSFASVVETMPAPEHVHVRFRTILGNEREIVLAGLHARCVFHETQHLDGRLMTDRMGVTRKAMFLKRVAKARGRRA